MIEYKMSRNGHIATIDLFEKLTAADVPALQSQLKEEIDAGSSEIVFNFAQVRVLDSTGIGLLIATSNHLIQTNGSVKLVNVSPDIFKLLKTMRLVDRLHASTGG